MEKPILFSAPMIRAILDGRKTQTRRAITRSNVTVMGDNWSGKKTPWEGLRFKEAFPRGEKLMVPFCHPNDEPMPSSECGLYAIYPKWYVGQMLWVREAHILEPYSRADAVGIGGAKEQQPGDQSKPHVLYRADYDASILGAGWRPSIHMPRWASRITLRVTGVKVERLQEISEADAKAEGAMFHDGRPIGHHGWRHDFKDVHPTAKQSFFRLWNDINGPGSWDANPWVAAIKFEKVKL